MQATYTIIVLVTTLALILFVVALIRSCKVIEFAIGDTVLFRNEAYTITKKAPGDCYEIQNGKNTYTVYYKELTPIKK